MAGGSLCCRKASDAVVEGDHPQAKSPRKHSNDNAAHDPPSNKNEPSLEAVSTDSTEVELVFPAPRSKKNIFRKQAKDKKAGTGEVRFTVENSRFPQDVPIQQLPVSSNVHFCSSTNCEVCGRNGVSFVSAELLKPKMVNKLRTGTSQWWEIGEPFADLYRKANPNYKD